jgi:two-component system, OmpR family, response regulator RpaA
MQTANILVIEDDDFVARTIERCLRGDEFKVARVGTGVEGLQTARRNTPDLVILDVIMPGMDGYTVCREMRSDPLLSEVPILFLTAKTKDEDIITGFNAGADDYLSKPFNVTELILRVKAILRRTHQMRTARIQDASPKMVVAIQDEDLPAPKKNDADRTLAIGPYTLNARTYELSTPDHGKIRLTPVQYDLLYHLMSHPGEIFSPARLLDEVWDYPSDSGSPDLVRVHVKNLRERIEKDPRYPQFIQTVPGYGYTIQPVTDGSEQ